MNEKLKSEYIRYNLIKVSILLGIILIGIIAYKLIEKNNAPSYEEWTDAEYGDIVVNNDIEEIEEIPENIFDGFGLEYEYEKLPSVGISTYKPIRWNSFFEDDFFYFTAPEGDEKTPHVEIALCVMNIGNINNTSDRIFAQRYVQENIKNHNTRTLVAKLITNNEYIPIKDAGELFAYYATPDIEFRREDDASKGGWNPYSVIYMLNTDSDITTFCCVSGPRNYIKEIDEIAKTIAYNTEKYTNTQFDFNELMNVNMVKKAIGDVQYLVKDVKNIESDMANANTIITEDRGVKSHQLSGNINSLAFNEKLVVKKDSLDDKDIDEYIDKTFMETIYMYVSSIYSKTRPEITRKGLEPPTFSIDSSEKIPIAGKDARKVVWKASIASDSSGRNKTDSIMPKMFATYLFKDDNNIYSFTINYTKYQKYAAIKYMEKTMETISLSSD